MPSAIVTVDLGFGDSGKGTIVDYLCSERGHKLVVRFNGGAQAAHNVCVNGLHHTFAQFGSGTLIEGVNTLLSNYVIVNPIALLKEASTLQGKGVNTRGRVYVERECLVTTPYHRAYNRLLEISRGADAHGSCGMGVGQTHELAQLGEELALRIKHLKSIEATLSYLKRIREYYLEKIGAFELTTELSRIEASTFDIELLEVISGHFQEFTKEVMIISHDVAVEMVAKQDSIFESAQGVLLDQDFGFHPYTTWSKATTSNATSMLAEAGVTDIHKLGIVRALPTRHGPGPFPSYCSELTNTLVDKYNVSNRWQRAIRWGWFDQIMAWYALKATAGVDSIAVTHVDKIPEKALVVDGYNASSELMPLLVEQSKGRSSNRSKLTDLLMRVSKHTQSVDTIEYLKIMEKTLGPISIQSAGPSRADKVTVC